MKKSICFILVLGFLLSFAACSSSEPAQAVQKHTLSYIGGEVKTIEPHDGELHTLVCVYTEYTNRSGETALPADWVNVKAYQHGVEIPILVFTGTKVDEFIQCDTAVQDGTTVKVIWTFQPEDESEISVELSTGEKYSIEGTVANVGAIWATDEMPVHLRYDRMWVYGDYAETDDAAMITAIIDALRQLTVGEKTDYSVTDFTDILTFTFSDGSTRRIEFEEYNWINERDRYHVEGLAVLRGLLDEMIEAKQAEAIQPMPTLVIEAGGKTFYAVLEDNSSAAEFAEKLSDGPITVDMHDYGNFEKVGSLPWSLPRNDTSITTEPGDVILYQGNQITIYYDQNTWDFTRLAKIGDVTREDLLSAFGEGDVKVELWIEWSE